MRAGGTSNVTYALYVLHRNVDWNYILKIFMKKKSPTNVHHVTTSVQFKVIWWNMLKWCMRRSNPISVQFVALHLLLKDPGPPLIWEGGPVCFSRFYFLSEAVEVRQCYFFEFWLIKLKCPDLLNVLLPFLKLQKYYVKHNVCSAEKVTKYSSNTLLLLVTYSVEQT